MSVEDCSPTASAKFNRYPIHTSCCFFEYLLLKVDPAFTLMSSTSQLRPENIHAPTVPRIKCTTQIRITVTIGTSNILYYRLHHSEHLDIPHPTMALPGLWISATHSPTAWLEFAPGLHAAVLAFSVQHFREGPPRVLDRKLRRQSQWSEFSLSVIWIHPIDSPTK